MHYLILSPTPIHPATGGNRALILSMVHLIKQAGHRVSFYYSVQEAGDSPEADAEMAKLVDRYYKSYYHWETREAATARAKKKYGEDCVAYNYELDDWYNEETSKYVAEIYAQDPFDVLLVNYIWMSKAFEAVPPHVIKMQQTHDAFSDRMIKLSTKQGFSPGFFSVSPQDEARGLGRADINIALQKGEELFFRTLTEKPVVTLQHIPEERPFIPASPPQGRNLRVGFVGGDNNINVKTIFNFVECLARAPAVAEGLELCIFGAVCNNFGKEGPAFVKLMGVQESIRDVYESMDVMINPMEEGTGLKIKSVEALHYHRPILMTGVASEGLFSPYHFHRCKTNIEVIGYLKMIIDKPVLLPLLQAAGEKVLNAYRHRLVKASEVLTAPREFLAKQARSAAQMQPAAFKGKDFIFCRPVEPEERAQIERLRRYVPKKAVWLDIGSRDGVFIILSAFAFQLRRAIVMEFDDAYIDRIMTHVMRNRIQNLMDMRLIGFAAGKGPGYGKINEDGGRRVAEFYDDADLNPESTVPFIKTDDFLANEERIDIISCNRHNALDIVSGLEGVINKCRPVLFIHEPLGDGKLETFMRGKNYSLAEKWGDEENMTLVFTSCIAQAAVENAFLHPSSI